MKSIQIFKTPYMFAATDLPRYTFNSSDITVSAMSSLQYQKFMVEGQDHKF